MKRRRKKFILKKNPGENQKTNTNFIKEIREEEKISSKKKEPEKLHQTQI